MAAAAGTVAIVAMAMEVIMGTVTVGIMDTAATTAAGGRHFPLDSGLALPPTAIMAIRLTDMLTPLQSIPRIVIIRSNLPRLSRSA
jgi:hypothetical protein